MLAVIDALQGAPTEAEQRAEALSSLLRGVVEALPCGLVVTSADGRPQLVNSAALELLCASRPGAEPMTPAAPTTEPQPGQPPWSEAIRRALAGEPFEQARVVLQLGEHADWRWVDVTARPLRGPDGTVIAAVAVLDDVSCQKQAEATAERRGESLRRSEGSLRDQSRILRSVLDSMREGVVVVDPAGNTVMRNAVVSTLVGGADTPLNQWTEMFDVLRRDAVTPLPPEELPNIRVVAGELVDQVEVYLRNRETREGAWLSVSGCPLRGDDGTIDGGVLVYRDVTESVEARRVLARRAQDLARYTEELEEFAYVAAHDLQEPLRHIVSYVQLLQRRFRAGMGPEADEFIEHVVEGSHRMQELLKDLLVYTRAGSRHVDPPGPVDLNAVMATITDTLSQAITETGASIEAGCLPVVLGRRNLIVQLFENLVDNALKYRGEAPPQIQVGAFREDDRWVLRVTDNGIGFDPRYGDRIFRLFKRLHDRGTYDGTGLGLAIARRAVERHGGRIWVESQPGEGSSFYFTLPALPA